VRSLPVLGQSASTLSTAAFAALAVPLLLAGCGTEPEPPPPEIRPVRVISVEKGSGGETVALTGTVQAQTEINLAFRIDGRVVERAVNVGDAVKAGQVVARLNPDNERSALQGARADLVAAQGQLVEARNNFDRQRRLLEQGFISKAAFDAVEQTLLTAQSRVTSMQSQVEIAQNRLGYTELVADAAGVVTKVGAEPGEVVGAGRMVVQLARDDGRDAVFDVPARLKDAAPANPDITVALTTDPGVSSRGRVREVSPRADPVTGTFQVRVGLIDPPAALRLGSTVTGRLRLEGLAGIQIPAAALIQSQGRPAVWVVDPASQTVSLRNVDVASFDPAAAVVSQGLLPGDIVVTAGVHALRPGQKVRLLGAAQ
jgi:RND family efflux transporter MFP subunit